jgi:hypothetical protein
MGNEGQHNENQPPSEKRKLLNPREEKQKKFIEERKTIFPGGDKPASPPQGKAVEQPIRKPRKGLYYEENIPIDKFLRVGKETEGRYSQEKYPSLEDKANYLRSKYNIGIVYGVDYKGKMVEIKKAKQEDDIITLDYICKAMDLLPMELVRNFPKTTILLYSAFSEPQDPSKEYMGYFIKIDGERVKDNGNNACVVVTTTGILIPIRSSLLIGGKVFNKYGPVYYASYSTDSYEQRKSDFLHEIFHGLDWKSHNYEDDDPTWISKTKRDPKPDWNNFYNFNKYQYVEKPIRTSEGFSNLYGSENTLEDQATIAEALFDKESLRELILRSKEDVVLREKIELITACVLDVKKGRFLRTMTEKEYSKFSGFKGYHYYYAWSEGKMDHKYWNAILDGKPMKF